MDKYPNLEAISSEVAMKSVGRILSLIQHQFGAIAVRNLAEEDLKHIEAVLYVVAMDAASRVDGVHSRARLQESYAATMNVFRASVAGGAAMKRDLTGEEPSEFERLLVLGSSSPMEPCEEVSE